MNIFGYYRQLENLWFEKVPQKLRFLLVGGFNTSSAYLLFIGLYFLLNHRYNLALASQYFLSANISIITMRYYVFRGKGVFLWEYLKAGGVYLCMLGFNLAWLNIFIEYLKINAPVSQFFYIIVSAILTYLLHKHLSFKQKKSVSKDPNP